MGGMRSGIRGAPGGRTRYPITKRKVKLETAMDASAISKNSGIMVPGSPPSLTSAFEPFSSFLEQFSPRAASRAVLQLENLPRAFQANQIGREYQNFFELQNKIESVRELPSRWIREECRFRRKNPLLSFPLWFWLRLPPDGRA